MQLEQVDTVQLHAAQAHLCFLAQIRRPADRRPLARARAGDRAKAREPRLRCNHEALRVGVQRLPDQFFSDIRSVGVGGVDEVHPELDRATEHADRLVVIARWAPNARSGQLHRPIPETIDRELAAEAKRARPLGGEEFRGHLVHPFDRRHRRRGDPLSRYASSLADIYLVQSDLRASPSRKRSRASLSTATRARRTNTSTTTSSRSNLAALSTMLATSGQSPKLRPTPR